MKIRGEAIYLYPMPIPKHSELQLPLLSFLRDGKEKNVQDLLFELASHFSLSEEEITRMYDSGNGPIFKNRVQWALSYLNLAKLLDKPRRGHYRINKKGLELLRMPNDFSDYMNRAIAEAKTTRNAMEDNNGQIAPEKSDLTPEETLIEGYEGIKDSVIREILDTILSKKAVEFERLVIHLLQKMGYGDKVVDSGKLTPYTNDKGIDGTIKEDVLGFGKIQIQAKRNSYDNKVSREDIQKFVGALATAQSEKGVFITTSDFSKGAYEYAGVLSSSSKIVLINGQKLAQYIYDYGLGVQTQRTFEIKKLDTEFWDTLEDDE